jgi:heptosyltransferase II
MESDAMDNHSRSSLLHPQRILVRGVNWLGDAVMSMPALVRLREARPEAHIALLTHEKLADLWRRHPAIDDVLTFAESESLWKIAKRLRTGRFDLGLTLPNSTRSALELWFARIPRRVGHRAAARLALLTETIPPRAGAVRMRKRSTLEIRRLIRSGPAVSLDRATPDAHQMHHYLHLVSVLGASSEPVAPHAFVDREEIVAVQQKFGLISQHAKGGLVFGLNPGAEYGPAKRWPAARFAAAAIELRRSMNCRLLIFGGQREIDAASRITAEINATLNPPGSTTPQSQSVLNLAGKTSLRELMALLQSCSVLLTNDTGPMHLAAAVGTPIVALYGSTSPELTAPGLPGDRRHQLLRACVPCAPCFRRTCPIDFRCMLNLTVDQVVAAVMSASTHRGSW